MIVINNNRIDSKGTEIVSARSERAKTFINGKGGFSTEIGLGSMHYKNDYKDAKEGWKDVDLTPVDMGDHYLINKASTIIKIYKDKPSYEITSKRSGHKFTVALDGDIPKSEDISFDYHLFPNRIRLWKTIKHKDAPQKLKWLVKEENIPENPDLIFRDNPEAYDYNEAIPEVTTKTTAIQKGEYYWEEELTGTAKTNTENPLDSVAKSIAYPIRIDTDVDEAVGATADTAYGIVGRTEFTTPTDRWNAGTFDASYVGYFSAARFQTVNIPKNATISTASMTCICSTAFTGLDVRTQFDAIAEDSAGVPASPYATFMARSRTTAKVDWNITASWSVGTTYTSPSIATVVQEMVNRAGWAANNDMIICWNNNASPTAANNLRRGAHYNHATYGPPHLLVTYTVNTNYILISNAWKVITATYILISNVWKTVTNNFVLISDAWKSKN